jgi:hypothetical protein
MVTPSSWSWAFSFTCTSIINGKHLKVNKKISLLHAVEAHRVARG